MPQTPKSVSANLAGTNVTLYTVPGGATAVVKTALGQNVVGGSSSITLQKVSSGFNYPLNLSQNPTFTPATGGTTYTKNLLDGPVTLTAGESVTAFDSSTPQYKFPATGNTFVPSNSASYQAVNMVAGNGIYVMAVRDVSNNTSMILRSADANTWTEIATGNLLPLSDTYYIARSGSTWVVAAWNTASYIYSTDNALTWTLGTVSPSTSVIYDVEANSTTFAFATAGGLYTSTSLPTLTLNTTLAAIAQSTNNASAPSVITWNGTYWFIAAYNGTVVTTDFVTFQNLFMQTGLTNNSQNMNSGPTWSSVYSKWYNTIYNSTAGNDIIFSSTNGMVWDRTQIASTALNNGAGRVNVAGSNTVLLAKGPQNSTTLLKSTNGSTWASATDSRGYRGPMMGLANGVFISCEENGASGRFYLSTDPSTNTGTQFTAGAGSFADFRSAASNGTGWILLVNNTSSSQIQVEYGPNSTTRTGTSSIGYDYPSYGNPNTALWWPAASLYVVMTDLGWVFSSSDGGVSWTAVMYHSANEGSLVVHNNLLYFMNRSSSPFVRSSTVAQFTAGTYTTTSLTTNIYPSVQSGYQTASNAFPRAWTSGSMSSNGTTVAVTNTQGLCWLWQPQTNVATPISPGSGGVTVERVNSLDFVYTGATFGNNGTYGFFYSSNIYTTIPTASVPITSSVFSYSPAQTPNSVGNQLGSKITFYGGTYFVCADGLDSLWSGTNVRFLSSNSLSGTSIGGVTPILASASNRSSNRFQSDGTNFLTFNNTNNFLNVYKGTTPLATRASSTITLGVVEIT